MQAPGLCRDGSVRRVLAGRIPSRHVLPPSLTLRRSSEFFITSPLLVPLSHRQSTGALSCTQPSLLQARRSSSSGEIRKGLLTRASVGASTMQSTEAPRVLLNRRPYNPPEWAKGLGPIPAEQLCLANVPTPIHKWNIPGLPKGTNLYIKRDDLSGMELSGNKIRKLEFLLAQALEEPADCVITIGGIQSNHCRATTVAARYVGLDTHLVLRTSKAGVDSDPGLVGNLLVERLCGAHVHLVTKEEYGQHGSLALGQMLLQKLKDQGRRPYLIPVGGSNALGTWGYIEAVREIEDQVQRGAAGGASKLDVITMACGSGGTTGGLALGTHLSSLNAKVVAYGVCDSPRYFYEYIQGIFDGLGASNLKTEDLVEMRDVKGQGYALSTEEELSLVKEVAASTGIVLDPVYSGKALKGMLDDMNRDPSAWEGKNVLFVHTGGLLGMYDKIQQLQPLVGDWQRMSLA